jgi:DNA-directed RNA polymerase beta subunit
MATPPRRYRESPPNQLYRELLGINGLNFADGTDSSSRKQMFSSHIGQSLVVKGATERFILTGMEAEYAKYTFAKTMPERGRILKVFNRYRTRIGEDAINHNPQQVVVYESANPETLGQIGMVNLQDYFSDQTYFGFEYKPNPETLSRLAPGEAFEKGDVFLDTPSRGKEGEYKYGVECNIAYMTHPATSEDGILISRDVLDKFKIKIYERREVEWGSRYFPLNLYGDPANPLDYKPFPEIGDYIRSDGLLMALRREDPALAAVEQSIHKLRAVKPNFDRTYYAAGAGGRIVDIRVHHDEYANSTLPVEFEAQVQKYYQATKRFYKEIIDYARELERSPKGKPIFSPEFHHLVYEAYVACGAPQNPNGPNERVQKLFRKNPLDDWRVEFVIEYEITPNIGNKFTECHGGKGVVCAVANPEDMPVDEDGNRADIVMDPNGKLSRMNLGGMYEPYFNSASRDMLKKLRKMLGVEQKTPALKAKLDAMEAMDPQLMNEAWEWVLGYIKIISPERAYRWFTEGHYRAPRTQYLASIISHSTRGMQLYMPPENEPEFPDMVRQIEAGPYRPLYGPVTYRGYSGRLVTTKRPVRIGSIYIIMLEKIAKDWTACPSGKLQHFGVLSQITSWDKYSQPTRTQPIRTMGESEIRIYVSYAGQRVTADLLDRNNNPKTRRFILDTILRSQAPTNIDRVVDRKVVPYGGNKPLQLIKHMGQCGGWELIYAPYKPLHYNAPVYQ